METLCMVDDFVNTVVNSLLTDSFLGSIGEAISLFDLDELEDSFVFPVRLIARFNVVHSLNLL
jgi:hypothetical protein